MVKLIFLSLLFLFALVPLSTGQQPALFPIEKNGKSGYIDNTGKVIIKPIFDEAESFNEGLAPVRTGDDWGFIDTTGKIVIKPQFFEASGFSDGIASVGVWFPKKKVIDQKVGYYSYIDTKGSLITDQQFYVASTFSEGLGFALTEDDKRGFINKSGKYEFFFDPYSLSVQNGLVMFKTKGNMPDTKVGYIDKTGKIAIPATFMSGLDFSEGFGCVSSDKSSGFIDTSGRVTIDFKYDDCGSFSEGLASIRMKGLIGFIDKSGKIVIQPQFEPVMGSESRFSDGVAVVQVGESEKLTRDGLRDVMITAEGNMYAAKSGLFGVIDKTGKFIIPP